MPQPLDSKAESLRQQGALNPHPQKVADPVFLRGEFFDPRDLVQVKYEMLRRVRVEGASVTQVVSGVRVLASRFLPGPSALPQRRLARLDPSTPGPPTPPQTLRPDRRIPAPTPTPRPALASPRALGAGPKAIRPGRPSSEHRTRLGAQTKKSPMIPDAPRDQIPILPDEPWATRYEELRKQVMAETGSLDHTYGYALLVRRGLVAWMKAWPRPAPEPSRDPRFQPAGRRRHGPLASPPVSRLPAWST